MFIINQISIALAIISTSSIYGFSINNAENRASKNILMSQRLKLESVSLSLVSCERAGRFVKCGFTIVSKVDQTVTFGYCGDNSRTRMIFKGKQYFASSVGFGGKFRNDNCGIQNSMLSEIPLEAELVFDGISSSSNSSSALEISIQSRSGWEFAQYKKVLIN